MKSHIETNTLPLSIANVDSSVYLDLGIAAAREAAAGTGAPPGLPPAQIHMLAAVACRAGEVEAAEWALDQAQSACHEQIVAALSSGLPPELVAKAAGVCASTIAEIIEAQAPAAS